MSSEMTNPKKPSPSTGGEGWQDQGGQSRKDVGPKSSKPGTIGGVGGGGGSGSVVRVSCENCGDAVASGAATLGPSQAKGKAEAVAAVVGAVHSSEEPADIKTAGERRDGTCSSAQQSSEGWDDGQGDELWIETSEKVQKLQRVLYRKAKAQPQWRFYSLYGELCRLEV